MNNHLESEEAILNENNEFSFSRYGLVAVFILLFLGGMFLTYRLTSSTVEPPVSVAPEREERPRQNEQSPEENIPASPVESSASTESEEPSIIPTPKPKETTVALKIANVNAAAFVRDSPNGTKVTTVPVGKSFTAIEYAIEYGENWFHLRSPQGWVHEDVVQVPSNFVNILPLVETPSEHVAKVDGCPQIIYLRAVRSPNPQVRFDLEWQVVGAERVERAQESVAHTGSYPIYNDPGESWAIWATNGDCVEQKEITVTLAQFPVP